MAVTDSVMPEWLIVVAWISLALGVVCALIIVGDIARRPQPMKVMNVVWPICALFGSVVWLAGYLWWGRADLPEKHTGSPVHTGGTRAEPPAGAGPPPATGSMADMGSMTDMGSMPGMKGMTGMTSAGMDSMAGMKGMAGMGRPALGLSGKPHSMPVSVFCGTSHCGAGCSLADLIVEWTLFAVPSFAVVGGLHWLFPD